MRVVLALDKFKGTFTALQVNELIAEGIRARNPKIEIIMRPMADGGDGTAALLAEAMGLEAMRVEVPDLLGRIIDTQIYWQSTRRVVIIDAAEILGISRAVGQQNVVQNATSLGLARLVQHALKLCPREIWIGIGGTFTADAGWGFAHAFGFFRINGQKNAVCQTQSGWIFFIKKPVRHHSLNVCFNFSGGKLGFKSFFIFN